MMKILLAVHGSDFTRRMLSCLATHRDTGALKNLVLGSIATKVLARCSVPVLLVR